MTKLTSFKIESISKMHSLQRQIILANKFCKIHPHQSINVWTYMLPVEVEGSRVWES